MCKSKKDSTTRIPNLAASAHGEQHFDSCAIAKSLTARKCVSSSGAVRARARVQSEMSESKAFALCKLTQINCSNSALWFVVVQIVIFSCLLCHCSLQLLYLLQFRTQQIFSILFCWTLLIFYLYICTCISNLQRFLLYLSVADT